MKKITKIINGQEVFVHRCSVCNQYKDVSKNFKFKDGVLANKCHGCQERKNQEAVDLTWRWSDDVVESMNGKVYNPDPIRFYQGKDEADWED